MSPMCLLMFLVTFLSVLHSSSGYRDLHAYLPGDIMIGGLFPIHETDPGSICSEFNTQKFLRSQVMVYAIQEINQRMPRLLPNITLGYDIYDTCGDVSLAIRAALQLLKKQSDPQSCPIPTSINSSLAEPEVKVVIGERYSEVSIAVARIFAVPSITQISYASTSEQLSKKSKFPTFLRTVSSDKYQTRAIYEFVKDISWQSVAIVGSDDEYGTYGTNSLQKLFDQNICVDFVAILPDTFKENCSEATALIKQINDSKAEAIILFTKDTNVDIIIKAVIKEGLNRTWIASDSWSTSKEISKFEGIEKIGTVFGFIYRQEEVPGFNNYLTSMFNGTTSGILNYYQLLPNNSKDDMGNMTCDCENKTSNQKCLYCYIDHDESYSVYLAVQVVAEGVRRLLKCDNQSCERTKFTAIELFHVIRNINITVNETNLYFDENGDPSLGYDIMLWNKTESKEGVEIITIGAYWPNKNISFQKDISQWRTTQNVTVFNCSRICQQGKRLNLSSGKCCFECVPCSADEYSNGTGTFCTPCKKNQYSPDGRRNTCEDKTEEFLDWADPFSIILNIMAAFAIIVTVVITIIISINYGTPIVKAIGGFLCYVEVASLLLSFCITFTFIGKPTERSCLGIPLFGISFSLCIACILANLIQIMHGFSFDPRVCSRIKKLNHPVALIIIISGVQAGVTLAWLIVFPPSVTQVQKTTTILYQCDMCAGCMKYFSATIAYNAFWGFMCFIFAFKGKELPDIYKNASLISVSMVLFLIIWIIFLPIFLTLEGKYKPAISSAAILISCYSILGCHLAPKCYIMLFKKEINNQNAISEYIRKHYEKKDINVISS